MLLIGLMLVCALVAEKEQNDITSKVFPSLSEQILVQAIDTTKWFIASQLFSLFFFLLLQSKRKKIWGFVNWMTLQFDKTCTFTAQKIKIRLDKSEKHINFTRLSPGTQIIVSLTFAIQMSRKKHM